MIREDIVKSVEKAIKSLQKEGVFPDFEMPEVKISVPQVEKHGDYSSNIAMLISGKVKKNPLDVAYKLSEELSGNKLFRRVDGVKPGFVNFFLSAGTLETELENILKDKAKYGSSNLGKKKKVNVEFVSANPTGELHIGHGRGCFLGDALCNIFEKSGYKVTREYYINDAKKSNQIKELGKTVVGRGESYLNPYIKGKMAKLKGLSSFVKKHKDKGDEVLFAEAGCLLANEIQKDIKRFIEKDLKVKFDVWIHESDFYKGEGRVKKAIDLLKRKGLVYEKEGALWIKTSEYGDGKDWVVVRETGEPTYLASDIVYHQDKFDRKFDKVINIWGSDHQGIVKRMEAIVKILGYKGEFDVLISQVVRVKGGKISKREGKVITLKWLIGEVGLDVARFFYLTKSPNAQMEFDVALAKEHSEKNPVYYVQYAYARACSVLKKAKIRGKDIKLEKPSELVLAKELGKFPEIVEDAAMDYQVQRLPKYAIDLAIAFHKFYQSCQVISDDKKLTRSRLALVSAAQTVIKNTLDLMGVSAPEKM